MTYVLYRFATLHGSRVARTSVDGGGSRGKRARECKERKSQGGVGRDASEHFFG